MDIVAILAGRACCNLLVVMGNFPHTPCHGLEKALNSFPFFPLFFCLFFSFVYIFFSFFFILHEAWLYSYFDLSPNGVSWCRPEIAICEHIKHTYMLNYETFSFFFSYIFLFFVLCCHAARSQVSFTSSTGWIMKFDLNMNCWFAPLTACRAPIPKCLSVSASRTPTIHPRNSVTTNTTSRYQKPRLRALWSWPSALTISTLVTIRIVKTNSKEILFQFDFFLFKNKKPNETL